MKTDPPPQDNYRRRLNPAKEPIPPCDEWKLDALGQAMTDEDATRDSAKRTAGYTYFGQFIDHDLTWNRAELDARQDVHVTGPNFRTARLDLDHVYGGGPSVSKSLYQGEKDAECFKIGPTPGGIPRDLPFEGVAVQIGDSADYRNTENFFVRQLHVLFLKFHNTAVEQLQKGEVEGDIPTGGTVFERARRLATWNYQWLVWNDFLGRLIDRNLWRSPRALAESTQPIPVQLPIEFALAAFRFGHSMVRNSYALNCHRPLVLLSALINSKENMADRLQDHDLIEWGLFFKGLKASGPPVFARRIDTHIAAALHALEVPAIRLFSPPSSKGPEVINLPVRTLLRGARAQLASGQEAADRLGEIRIPQKALDEDDSKAGRELRNAKLTGNTPLWYYILKEAELSEDKGERLGSVGSRLVLETIEEVLQNDRESYLFQKGPKWKLPRWKFPGASQHKRERVKSMASLVRLVGDSVLLRDCKPTKWSELMERYSQISGEIVRFQD